MASYHQSSLSTSHCALFWLLPASHGPADTTSESCHGLPSVRICYPKKTQGRLNVTFLRIWFAIPMIFINRLIHSMYRRCVSVVLTRNAICTSWNYEETLSSLCKQLTSYRISFFCGSVYFIFKQIKDTYFTILSVQNCFNASEW